MPKHTIDCLKEFVKTSEVMIFEDALKSAEEKKIVTVCPKEFFKTFNSLSAFCNKVKVIRSGFDFILIYNNITIKAIWKTISETETEVEYLIS